MLESAVINYQLKRVHFCNNASSAMPQHWSKDYVEHMRTVHFALAGVSLALIIVVLTSRPYNPIAALREMEQILKLKKDWSPVWLRQDTSVVRTEIENQSDDVPKTGGVDEFVEESDKPAANETEFFDFVDISSPKPSRSTYRFLLPRDNWYQEPWSSVPPTDFPESLSDFKRWWDSLPAVVYFPGAYSTEGWVQEGPDPTKKIGRIFPVLKMTEDTAKSVPFSGSKELDLDVHLDASSFSYVYVDKDLNVFVIPIFKLEKAEVSRASLGTKFGWKNASFEEAFPDLSLSAKGLEVLDLDRIRQILSDDATKGSQVLEAFGIKFPAEQISTWGVLIVLSVQLYLLAYLIEFAGRIKDDDAGWDVPWIGTNDTALGKLIFFITLVVMPCVALAVLGHFSIAHSLLQGHDTFIHALHSRNALFVSCWVAVLGVSLYLAIRSWSYRPLAVRQTKSSLTALQPNHPSVEPGSINTPPNDSEPSSEDDHSATPLA